MNNFREIYIVSSKDTWFTKKNCFFWLYLRIVLLLILVKACLFDFGFFLPIVKRIYWGFLWGVCRFSRVGSFVCFLLGQGERYEISSQQSSTDSVTRFAFVRKQKVFRLRAGFDVISGVWSIHFAFLESWRILNFPWAWHFYLESCIIFYILRRQRS